MIILTDYRNPWDVLRCVESSIPSPGVAEVLLRVHAVGLNIGSSISMKTMPSFMIKKPAIPETDVAGTIVSVGKEVQQWKEGDQVFGAIPASDMYRRHQGGLREYALLKAENMYHPL